MAKSQQSFNKKEKEKKRQKRKKEKMERREQRKLEKAETGPLSFEDQIMYVDENGNLSSTPPDPTKKHKIKAEDIVLGVPTREHEEIDHVRTGIVKFFNDEKGYGFITDLQTKESIFVHINNVQADKLVENNRVSFEVEMGQKGPNAVKVKMAPAEVKPAPVKEEENTPEKEDTEKSTEDAEKIVEAKSEVSKDVEVEKDADKDS